MKHTSPTSPSVRRNMLCVVEAKVGLMFTHSFIGVAKKPKEPTKLGSA